MKKLLLLSMTAMLMAACGNEEETKEKGASKVETETPASTEGKKEVSTEEKSKETKKVVEKKDSTEEKSLSGKYPYMDKDGHIDILSDAFVEEYTRHNRITGFAGITQGMDVAEVEKMYGKPTHDGKSRISSDHERFGDIAIENTDYKVSQIYINSSTPVTKSQVIEKYTPPTFELTSKSEGITTIVYNNDKDNGFQLLVTFDENDQFISMEQVGENVDVSNDFYYDKTVSTSNEKSLESNEVTEEDIQKYIVIQEQPNEAEKSGSAIDKIEDFGDKWRVLTYHLSGGGMAPIYMIDKKTGDATYIMGMDESEAPNVFDTIK